MFEDLSKESNALLVSMYKRYLELRKVGEPRFNARYFGDVESIKEISETLLSDADVTDITYWLREYGYVTCEIADFYALNIALTEKAIALCEKRFENGLKDVAAFLSYIKSLL